MSTVTAGVQNKIIHGDCLEVMQEIPDRFVDMILCDLPYGTTACKWDTVIPFEPLWAQYERIIKTNGAIVLFGSEPFSSALRMSNIKNYRYDWVWVKSRKTGFLNAKKRPLPNHENVLVFYNSRCIYNPQMKVVKERFVSRSGEYQGYGKHFPLNSSNGGKQYPFSVIEFQSISHPVHPTQKPVALFEYLIKTYTNEGETVLDNCIGSGTTAIACINTGRNYIGIEKDETYYDIAVKRIAEHERQLTIC
jgi:DNA modification methylase